VDQYQEIQKPEVEQAQELKLATPGYPGYPDCLGCLE